jgi:hypothetical protein
MAREGGKSQAVVERIGGGTRFLLVAAQVAPRSEDPKKWLGEGATAQGFGESGKKFVEIGKRLREPETMLGVVIRVRQTEFAA